MSDDESTPIFGLLTRTNERLDRMETIVVAMSKLLCRRFRIDEDTEDEQKHWLVLEEILAAIQNERERQRR